MHPRYPDSFFITAIKMNMTRTATPTGILLEPLDLVNHPQPWLLPTQSRQSENTHRKTLVFADHTFGSRTGQDKFDIMKNLRLAGSAGFKVYSVDHRTGELKKWRGEFIVPDYSLPLSTYTTAYLYQLAFSQLALPADEVYLLDYFGINELYGRYRYLIDYEDNHADELNKLVPVATQHYMHNFSWRDCDSLVLEFHSNGVKLSFRSEQCSDLLDSVHTISDFMSQLNSMDLNRIRSLEFSNFDAQFLQFTVLAAILFKAQHVTELVFILVAGAAPLSLSSLPLPVQTSLMQLTSEVTTLKVDGQKVRCQFVNDFINSFALENLMLENVILTFDEIPPAKLQCLKQLTLLDVDIAPQTLTCLLRSAKQLETIKLEKIRDVGFQSPSEIITFSLPSLITLEVDCCQFRAEELMKIIHGSPKLVNLVLEGNNNVDMKMDFSLLAPNSLPKLRVLKIDEITVSEASLTALLFATPQLEEMTYKGSEWLRLSSTTPRPPCLKTIRILDIDDATLSTDQLVELVRSVPQANVIHLVGSAQTDAAFQQLSVSDFKNIKCLVVIENDEFVDDAISLDNIRKILTAAPDLVQFAVRLYETEDMAKHWWQQLSSREKDLFISLYQASIYHEKTATNSHSQANMLTEEKAVENAVSFNVTASHAEMTFERYFPNVKPHFYRLAVYQPDMMGTEWRTGFPPNDFLPTTLKVDTYDPEQPREKGIFKNEKSTDHFILPSLNAEEEMVALKIVDAIGRVVPRTDYQHLRSESTQFHKVVLKTAGFYTAHFTVVLPKDQPALPAELERLRDRYLAHQSTNAGMQTFANLSQFAQFVRDNRTGSCLHVSLAAYEDLRPSYKQAVRIVENQLHAYLEVMQNKRIHKIDLGGYDVKLVEKPILHDTPQKIAQPTVPHALRQENRLVFVTSETQLQRLYRDLLQHNPAIKQDLFITHAIRDLSISGVRTTHEGKVVTNKTAFGEWLKNRKMGILIIDIRQLESHELPQLNDILDRRVEQTQLPATLQILLLDKPNRDYYGEDFHERVPLKNTLPDQPVQPVLAVALPPTAEEKFNEIEIDLNHSQLWQERLLGGWMLRTTPANQLNFYWHKTGIFSVIDNQVARPTRIYLKNIPEDDPHFLAQATKLSVLGYVEWADQRTDIGNHIAFYAAPTQGYAWGTLRQSASLTWLTPGEDEIHPLSDATILNFVKQHPVFSTVTNRLEIRPPHLAVAAIRKTIHIACSPDVSPGTLAWLLTDAAAASIQVVIHLPTPEYAHQHVALNQLALPVTPAPAFHSAIDFQVSDDLYFTVQQWQLQQPTITCFDLSALMTSELTRYPVFSEEAKQALVAQGVFQLDAALSTIAEKLLANETVVLVGKPSTTLFPVLLSFALGLVDGKQVTGKLILLSPTSDVPVLAALATQPTVLPTPLPAQKQQLLQAIYLAKGALFDDVTAFVAAETTASYAEYERQYLQQKLAGMLQPWVLPTEVTDAVYADLVDAKRYHDMIQALTISPVAMLEGTTGIGKTHFLFQLLAKQEFVTANLQEWLLKKAQGDEKLILAVDEANFLTELTLNGTGFLQRFLNLKAPKPGFYWQGFYYPLSPNHKVIFAFNPVNYGSGRELVPFMEEHKLTVPFSRLARPYVRERIIRPLWQTLQNDVALDDAVFQQIAIPITAVYDWIIQRTPTDEILITPRELRFMLLLIMAQISQYSLQEPRILHYLATEIAYDVGMQTLSEHPELIVAFQQSGLLLQRVADRHPLPRGFYEYQRDTYWFIQHALAARECFPTSMGLGAIILEGNSQIGKTYFINQIVTNYQKMFTRPVYRISPNMDVSTKTDIIKKIVALKTPALVVAEEINTGVWPVKLLNELLTADTQTIFVLATQNPRSYVGRHAEDPALRRRVVKLVLPWARFFRYEPTVDPQKTPGTTIWLKEPVVLMHDSNLAHSDALTFPEARLVTFSDVRQARLVLESLESKVLSVMLFDDSSIVRDKFVNENSGDITGLLPLTVHKMSDNVARAQCMHLRLVSLRKFRDVCLHLSSMQLTSSLYTDVLTWLDEKIAQPSTWQRETDFCAVCTQVIAIIVSLVPSTNPAFPLPSPLAILTALALWLNATPAYPVAAAQLVSLTAQFFETNSQRNAEEYARLALQCVTKVNYPDKQFANQLVKLCHDIHQPMYAFFSDIKRMVSESVNASESYLFKRQRKS